MALSWLQQRARSCGWLMGKRRQYIGFPLRGAGCVAWKCSATAMAVCGCVLRAGVLCIYTRDGPMCFQNRTAYPATTFTICLRIVREILGSPLSMGSTVFTSFPWLRIPGNKVCRIFLGEAC